MYTMHKDTKNENYHNQSEKKFQKKIDIQKDNQKVIKLNPLSIR